MPYEEINAITQCFVEQLPVRRVYLFGSFADGTYTSDSDLDFYLIVDAMPKEPSELIFQAYKSIRHVRRHPVDILAQTSETFEERKNRLTIENEVFRKGILLYSKESAA